MGASMGSEATTGVLFAAEVLLSEFGKFIFCQLFEVKKISFLVLT
jgi:hypothetical protein